MPDAAPPAAAPAAAPATTVAPAAPPAPAAAPPAAPAARAAKPPIAPGEEPPWMGERANRAARQYLKLAGIKVGKKDDVAKVAAEHRDKTTSWKTERNALRKENETLKASDAAAKAVLKVHSDQALAKLPEAAQTAIKALVGDDPVKILEHVALANTMTIATAPPAPAAGAPANGKPAPAKAPIPPGASTTAAGSAPAPATPTSPANHKEVYARLLEWNPVRAAQYAQRHDREIFDAKT